MVEQPPQELQGHVLKGQSRAMEKLHQPETILKGLKRGNLGGAENLRRIG